MRRFRAWVRGLRLPALSRERDRGLPAWERHRRARRPHRCRHHAAPRRSTSDSGSRSRAGDGGEEAGELAPAGRRRARRRGRQGPRPASTPAPAGAEEWGPWRDVRAGAGAWGDSAAGERSRFSPTSGIRRRDVLVARALVERDGTRRGSLFRLDHRWAGRRHHTGTPPFAIPPSSGIQKPAGVRIALSAIRTPAGLREAGPPGVPSGRASRLRGYVQNSFSAAVRRWFMRRSPSNIS
jgi:hypothetical protein